MMKRANLMSIEVAAQIDIREEGSESVQIYSYRMSAFTKYDLRVKFDP